MHFLKVNLAYTMVPKSNRQKSGKKLVADVLKDPKTSLERIRVAHNAFSCYDAISRGTARQIMAFLQEMLQKSV